MLDLCCTESCNDYILQTSEHIVNAKLACWQHCTQGSVICVHSRFGLHYMMYLIRKDSWCFCIVRRKWSLRHWTLIFQEACVKQHNLYCPDL